MSLLFAGKELRKFDQVNRMSIPPGYRKDLGEEEWEIFSMGFISAFSGEKQAKAQRKLADRVEKLTVDKSGRISIKDDFKAYAALEDEVLVVGTMNRVELWTPENWEAWNVDDDDDDFDFSNVSLSAPRV